MWHFAVWWKNTDVSEELSASIIRIGFEGGEYARLEELHDLYTQQVLTD
jgi:hypothetical protein